MKHSLLYRQGVWLQHKRNFLLAWTAWGGGCLAVGFLWKFWIPDVLWWLTVIGISFLGGFVSGLIMWEIMGKHYAGQRGTAVALEAGVERSAAGTYEAQDHTRLGELSRKRTERERS